MAVLRLLALASSLCLAAVFAASETFYLVLYLLMFRFIYIKNISLPDVRCGRFTHKHVWIQPDDQFIFSTQRKGEPFYKDKTRCSVRTLIVDLRFLHCCTGSLHSVWQLL